MDILAFGTLGFWALVAGFTIIMFALTEHGKWGWATFSILATCGLLHWLGGVPILSIVAQEPVYSVAAVSGYLLAGAVWAFAKWWFYVRSEKRKYDGKFSEMRERFCRHITGYAGEPSPLLSIPVSGWPDADVREWADFVRCNYNIDYRPSVAWNKGKIYHWIAFWPWSLAWTIIDDPVKRALDTIYDSIRGTLQRMSDKAWEGTK